MIVGMPAWDDLPVCARGAGTPAAVNVRSLHRVDIYERSLG